jgi:hypothetical protein
VELGGFVMRCHTSLTGVIPVLVEYALLRFVGGYYVHTGCLRSIAAAHFSVCGSMRDLTTVMNNIIALLLTQTLVNRSLRGWGTFRMLIAEF